MELRRAKPVVFTLADGRKFSVPCPTLDQVAACLALDPKDGAAPESAPARLARIRAQVEAMVGDSLPVGDLTPHEGATVLTALWAYVSGFDPEDQVRLSEFLSKKNGTPGSLT